MDKDYIGLQELSERISLSKRTIRSWIQDPTKRFPCIRVGQKLLFKKRDVEQFLDRFSVQVPEIGEVVENILSEMKGEKSR